MRTRCILGTFALALGLAWAGPLSAQTKQWTFEASLYGVAAGMSGDVGLGPINADVDVGFDQILENLKFGAMGTVRVGYGPWAISTDVIYMDLEASKAPFTARAQQWLVQPALEYQVCHHFGVYAGARYNSVQLELDGPLGINPSDTQDWWDPIIGARVSLPLGKKFSFNVSGDVGGFGVGSDLTWQANPFFNWQFNKWGSLQVGYRFLYTDYESGSGASRFKYDVMTSGPQFGFTVHF